MKKLIITILIIIVVFIIYIFNIDKSIYYLSIGDQISYGINNNKNTNNNYRKNIINKYNIKKHVDYSNNYDYRITDLLNDINYNKTISYNKKEYKIQNLLIKANLITISMGYNDIKNIDNNYDKADALLNDIEILFKTIRTYNKDKILYLSFYDNINNKTIVNYLNKKLKILCKKYKIKYVDISKLEYYIINEYPTNDGYTYITNKIFTKI